jgi:hypothetical protein
MARFYREKRLGDWMGYTQGLADFLEQRGILANDSLISHWDGSRLDLDRRNPRVELTITPYEDPDQPGLDLHPGD